MSVKIKVIGTPFIEVSGEKLHFPLKKAEALVYYLAVEGKENREKLAGLLWGEKDESSAYNNFRNALYLLRRSLSEDMIVSDRRAVYLQNAETDLGTIEAVKDPHMPISADICDDLLKDFDIPESSEFGEWLMLARSRMKDKLIESLKCRITSCYDIEDDEKLQKSLEMLLLADPFDEDYVLELIDLYCRQGAAPKAMSLFREFRSRLKNEMGLDPSSRAEELFRRMLMSPCGEETNNDNPEHFFLGRQSEQNLILNKIDRQTKQNLVIFIEGEPGVGKTCLVNRILHLLEGNGSQFFSTMSYEAGMNYPYSSWNNLVSQAGSYAEAEQIDISSINMSLLAGVFPNFLSEKHLSYNADLVKVSERTPVVIGRSVSRLVAKVSAGKRPVLMMEDLQWFDPQSHHMLETFLATIPVPAVLFLTSRPEKSDFVLRKLKRLEDNGTLELVQISLKPFDKDETRSFCKMFLSENQSLSRNSELVFNESEGLPLLVVELVKTLRSNSSVKFAKGGLGGVMLARFGELSEISREFLRILSVFTGGVQASTIISMFAESDASAASAAAEELLRKQMIQEEENLSGQILVNFKHAKVRECIYDSIPEFQRKSYHRRAAEALSKKYSPHTWNPELSSKISYHYTKANMLSNVLKQYLREMIFDITLNHDLFPMIQDDVLLSCKLPFSDRADTERKMNEMSDLLHNINRTSQEDPEILRLEATYLELRAGYMVSWGEYREGRIFINRAMRLAKERGFVNIQMHCLQHVGHHFLQTDNWNSLLTAAREMLTLAHDEEREKFLGIALRFIGVAFQIKGDFDRSCRVLERSVEVFEDLALMGKTYTLSILAAECYIGENYQCQGKYEEAIAHYTKCIETCEKKGFFWGCSHFHAHMADVAFDMNDWELMYSHIYRGAELFERCQGGRCGSVLYSLKAIADASRGDSDGALRSLEIGELLSAPIKKHSWVAVHLMAKAYLSVMKEKGQLPDTFNRILVKSSKEYATDAAKMYKEIMIMTRYESLKQKFSLDI